MTDAREPTPRRPDELPLSEWLSGAELAGKKLAFPIRQRVGSAFDHLRKAWRLSGTDNEMAAFRAITAEEEAATALILALKRQGYPGSKQLNYRRHDHKGAIWPTITAIVNAVTHPQMPSVDARLILDPPRLVLSVYFSEIADENGRPVPIEPDPPLHFISRLVTESGSSVHLFQEQFGELASRHGAGSVRDHLDNLANERNLILYASDEGLPRVEAPDDVIIERARRVGVLVAVTVAILQTRQHQGFVRQALEAMLKALDVKNVPTFSYEDVAIDNAPAKILIERGQKLSSKITVARSDRFTVTGVFGYSAFQSQGD